MLYHWFPDVIRGGYLGVVLFLMLSGYLVTSGMLSEFYRDGRLRVGHFYAKRFKRLYPPLVFFLLVLSTWIFIFQPALLESFSGNAISTLLGYNNWFQISQNLSYFDQHGSFNTLTHMWTMALEIQMYVIWPIIFGMVAMAGRHRLRRLLGSVSILLTALSYLTMIILYGLTKDVTRVYYGTDTRFAAFALGAFLACLLSRTDIKRSAALFTRVRSGTVAAALTVAMILMMLFMRGDSSFTYYFGLFLFTLLSLPYLVVIADRSTVAGKIYSGRLLCWFGRRSYVLYLWQYAIMMLFRDLFKFTKLSTGAVVLIQLPVLLILSELTYQLTERRFDAVRAFLTAGIPSRRRPVLRRRFIVSRAIIFPVILVMVTILTLSIVLPGHSGFKDELKERIAGGEPAITFKLGVHTDYNTLASEMDIAQGQQRLKGPDSTNIEENFSIATQAFPDLKLTSGQQQWLMNNKITCIGDSISESAKKELGYIMPGITVDAEVSRQFYDGLSILEQMKANNTIQPTILFALGTNAVINDAMLDELSTKFADHTIFLISIVEPSAEVEKRVNSAFASAVQRHQNLHLIDWYDFAKTKPDIFYEDATHPNIRGSAVYAQFIAKHIAEYYVPN